MSEPTNAERAHSAEWALLRFLTRPDPAEPDREKRASSSLAEFFEDATGDDRRELNEEAIGWLITDLIHLARREKCDLKRLLRCADRDYNAEIAEEKERLAYPEDQP